MVKMLVKQFIQHSGCCPSPTVPASRILQVAGILHYTQAIWIHELGT